MWVLACLALIAACKSPDKPVAHEPPPAAPGDGGRADDLRGLLGVVGGAGSASYADAMAKLAALRAAASPAERPLYDQMSAALAEMQAALTDPAHEHDHLVTGIRQLLAWMRVVADRYPDDVATQRLIASSMDMLVYQIENLDLDKDIPTEPIAKEAADREREIAERFPADARSWRMLGGNAMRAGDTLGAMRAYAKCARLDAKSDCADSLAKTKREYVLPYCDGADIRPELAWKEGHDRAVAGAVPMADPTWNGSGSLFVLPAARFGPKDVELVETRLGNDGKPFVSIELRKDVLAGYSGWFDEVQNRDAFVVMVVGDKLLATTHNSFFAIPIRNRDIGLPRATLADLCVKTQSRTLPPDL